MKCPDCEDKNTFVETTKPTDDEILRHRRCRKCGFRFKTLEWIDLSSLPKEILEKVVVSELEMTTEEDKNESREKNN